MLQCVLVGCGRIAQKHAELLGSGVIQGARLAAVCDTNLAKAEQLGKKNQVPFFKDMHEMIDKVKPDLISILTESGNHGKHIVELARYGLPIVVEKPLALSLEDADRAILACSEYGSKLFVVKQNRFNVPVLKLREAFEAQRFGKLVLGTVRVRWCREQKYYDQDSWRGTWAWDGGVITNQASHHVDLLSWFMGDVETVFAKSSTALVNIEVEDTAVVVLKFKSGALGIIEATTAARPKDLEGSLSILGEAGAVEIGGFAVNEIRHWAFSKPAPEDENVRKNFSVNPPSVYGFGHKAYYDHVVKCILENKPQMVDGLEGRKSLELISAIYESVETAQEVSLRFKPKMCKLGVA